MNNQIKKQLFISIFALSIMIFSVLFIYFVMFKSERIIEEKNKELIYPLNDEFCWGFLTQNNNEILYANNTRYYKVNNIFVEEGVLFKKCKIYR